MACVLLRLLFYNPGGFMKNFDIGSKLIKHSYLSLLITTILTSTAFADEAPKGYYLVSYLQEHPEDLSLLAPASSNGDTYRVVTQEFKDFNNDGHTDVGVVFELVQQGAEPKRQILVQFFSNPLGYIYQTPDQYIFIGAEVVTAAVTPPVDELGYAGDSFVQLSYTTDEPWTHSRPPRGQTPCNPYSWYAPGDRPPNCPDLGLDPNAEPYPPTDDERTKAFADSYEQQRSRNQEKYRQRHGYKWCNPELFYPEGDRCRGVGFVGNVIRWFQSWFYWDV